MSKKQPKKLKILILLADVGSGHKAAANALTQAFEKVYSDTVEVKSVDLFKEYGKLPFKQSAHSYKLATSLPPLEFTSNLLYKTLNTGVGDKVFSKFTFYRMYSQAVELLAIEKPDVVVSVHPIVSLITCELKQRLNSFYSVTVVTDLIDFMRAWADGCADLVFCPTPQARDLVVSYGVDPRRVVTGYYPLRPSLADYRPWREVLSELGLALDQPTVLLTSGGFGAANLVTLAKRLLKDPRMQLVVITGRLEKLEQRLKKQFADNPRIKILGFVERMQDYLNSADYIVSKPGPASILEIMLFNKKAILTKPIGVQEEANVGYALKNPKFRYISNKYSQIGKVIEDFRSHPELKDLKPKKDFDFDDSFKIVSKLMQEYEHQA